MEKQLKQGKSGENRVKILFESCGFQVVEVEKALRSHYDLVCTKGKESFTVEIKNDLKAKTTGNIAIEVFNPVSGKNSGLSITKANLWVHILADEIWLTSVPRLSSFVGIQEPVKIIKAAGDGNATIYLYKLDYIVNTIFHRIDNIDCNNVISILKGLLC